MKISHKVPRAAFKSSESVSPEYQAEVDRTTEKAMVAFERAQRRLEAAENRLVKAREAAAMSKDRKKDKHLARQVAEIAELVELRREELRQLAAVMRSVPASSQHRGRGHFRPVPQPGEQI